MLPTSVRDKQLRKLLFPHKNKKDLFESALFDRFVNRALRADGVLLLHFIERHAGAIVVRELAAQMFSGFIQKQSIDGDDDNTLTSHHVHRIERFDQNNADVLMAELEKLSQSEGAAPRLYPYQNWGYNERYRIKIVNTSDRRCMFYALVAARFYQDMLTTCASPKNAKGRRKITNRPRALERLVKDQQRFGSLVEHLMRDSNIPADLNSYGIDHLEQVQKHWDRTEPGKYRIVLFDDCPEVLPRPLWKGPPGRTLDLALFLSDGHYDALKVALFAPSDKHLAARLYPLLHQPISLPSLYPSIIPANHRKKFRQLLRSNQLTWRRQCWTTCRLAGDVDYNRKRTSRSRLPPHHRFASSAITLDYRRLATAQETKPARSFPPKRAAGAESTTGSVWDREAPNNFAALSDPDSVHYLGERLTRSKYDELCADRPKAVQKWMAELKTRIWHLDPAIDGNSRAGHAAKFSTTAELVEQVALTLPALGDGHKQRSTADKAALVQREDTRGNAKPWTAEQVRQFIDDQRQTTSMVFEQHQRATTPESHQSVVIIDSSPASPSPPPSATRPSASAKRIRGGLPDFPDPVELTTDPVIINRRADLQRSLSPKSEVLALAYHAGWQHLRRLESLLLLRPSYTAAALRLANSDNAPDTATGDDERSTMPATDNESNGEEEPTG
ncbi:hypothetical protein GPALN_012327 [Globodera pallida]|nr:hypothetical protein GPALN_012327 [Globodera pallida]